MLLLGFKDTKGVRLLREGLEWGEHEIRCCYHEYYISVQDQAASDREKPREGHALGTVHTAATRSGTTFLESKKGRDYTHEDKHGIYLVHLEFGEH